MKNKSGFSDRMPQPIKRPWLLLVCLITLGLPTILWMSSALTWSSSSYSDPLGFIPSDRTTGDQKLKCEELFEGTAAEDFSRTDLYEKSVSHFLRVSNIIRQGHSRTVTYDLPKETPQLHRTLQYIAMKSGAKVACIAGFNLGQAALSLLTANERLVVHAFRRTTALRRSLKMEKHLNNKFSNRLFVYDGDTAESIPRFISIYTNRLRCDVILITGPVDYHAAKADVTNLARIANLSRNHIIFADQLSDMGHRSGDGNGTEGSVQVAGRKRTVRAWEEGCTSGMLVEKMHCSFTPGSRVTSQNPYRGFAVGVVKRGPDARDGVASGLGQSTGQVQGNGTGNRSRAADQGRYTGLGQTRVQFQDNQPRDRSRGADQGRYTGPGQTRGQVQGSEHREDSRVADQGRYTGLGQRRRQGYGSEPREGSRVADQGRYTRRVRTREQDQGNGPREGSRVADQGRYTRRVRTRGQDQSNGPREGFRVADEGRSTGRVGLDQVKVNGTAYRT